METLVLSAVLAEQGNKRHREVLGEDEKKSETNQKKSTCKDDRKLDDKPEQVAPKKGRHPKEQFTFTVEPITIYVIEKPSTVVNHSYRDFSRVPPKLTYQKQAKIEYMTF
jgi:hypothetical protein